MLGEGLVVRREAHRRGRHLVDEALPDPHARAPGRSLIDVLLEAGAIRFKPILLTALAAMIGAAVILADPIFQGLAISLLFGLASSTALTVLVIPAIYVALRGEKSAAKAATA